MKGSVSILLFILFIFSQSLFSQEEQTIELNNPSFEGFPMDGTANGPLPSGWQDCGFLGETVPDVHPQTGGGAFQVTKEPFHGKTYIGMVVRDNDTWERISQRLSSPLKSNQCYDFTIYLCRSELYLSPKRTGNQEKVNYTQPAKLRIWGGNDYCQRGELLDESEIVKNTRWLPYSFRFHPKQNYSHLVFEVFYETPTPFPYNGNILLDNASEIVQVPCKEEPSVVDVVADNTSNTKPKPPIRTAPETTAVLKKPKILKALDRKVLKKGQVIRIEQLFFRADSPQLEISSYEVLDEMYDFLKENPDVIIEVGGHTNSLPEEDYCEWLSTERAKAVTDYLMQKGIPLSQLTYKGYGKRRPISPNTTEEGRKKNQRVEIKILSFNGI